MNLKRIVIIGASGHGSVACDAAEKQGYDIAGFLDSNIEINKEVFGYKVLGHPSDIFELAQEYEYTGYFVAISNNATRALVTDKFKNIAPKLENVSIIHPQSVVSTKAKLGEGVLILAGGIVNCDCVVDNGGIINTSSTLDHGGCMEPFASLLPGVSTGGNVKIGRESCVCIGATIIHNVVIGSYTVIGAGSVVLQDMPEKVLAYGIPAKVIRTRIIDEKHF